MTETFPSTGPAESEQDIGARLAGQQAGAGVGAGETSVDTDQLLAMIQQMQQQVNAMQDERNAGTADPVTGTVQTIQDLLIFHGDPAASELGEDLADAAKNGLESGDLSRVTAIGGKLSKYLKRHPPAPGDNHYSRQLGDFVDVHLPESVENYQPPAQARGSLPAGASSGRAPKVIQGNVTGDVPADDDGDDDDGSDWFGDEQAAQPAKTTTTKATTKARTRVTNGGDE